MTLTVSFSDSRHEVRKNIKPDRKCDACGDKIAQSDHYVHSRLFPMPWDELDFRVVNYCFLCINSNLWNEIHKKMCGENKSLCRKEDFNA